LLHSPADAGDGRTLDQHLVTVLGVRDGKIRKMGSFLSDPPKIVLYSGPPA
jgi:ketosteroid isomerase-like protein